MPLLSFPSSEYKRLLDEMTPSNTPLLSRADYIKTLVPVAICSASNPCPICQEEYSEGHAPVLLPRCGHIFGRSCIQEWLKGDANTCPMDRKVLFAPQKNSTSDEDGSWSLVSHTSSRSPVSTHSRHQGSENNHYVLLSGEIIALNGILTQEGCCHAVRDLWHQTGFFFRQMSQHAHDVDVFAVDDELLIGPIRDALPLGIQVPSGAWPGLVGMARSMLSWHCRAWEDGWSEGEIPEDAVWGFAEHLWVFCRGGNGIQS